MVGSDCGDDCYEESTYACFNHVDNCSTCRDGWGELHLCSSCNGGYVVNKDTWEECMSLDDNPCLVAVDDCA